MEGVGVCGGCPALGECQWLLKRSPLPYELSLLPKQMDGQFARTRAAHNAALPRHA